MRKFFTMSYTAVNTKIKALRAKLLTIADYEALCNGKIYTTQPQDELIKIACYLNKTDRDFINKPMTGLQVNEALRRIGKLDKSSGKSLKRMYGKETDIRNIILIYRLKKFYKIEGNAIFPYLIPFSYKLNTEEISRLSHTKDLDSFVKLVSDGAYSGSFNKLSDFTRGEQILSKAIRLQYKKESRKENLSVVCEYLYVKKCEEKNLHAIEVGIKNGLAPDKIFERLHI